MAERDAALQQQALQYAKLDPFQRATAGIYAGANRLGGAVGGLLGAQDPEMAKAAALQNILKQADTTTPEGLAALAQTLGSQGFGPQAMQVMDKAQALRLTSAKISAEEALAQQRLREKQATGLGEKVFAALAAKATPASVKAAQDAGNDISLLVVPENVKVSTYGQVLKDAGLKEGTPEFQQQMQAFAAAELEGTRKGKGTTVTLPGQQVPQKEWLPFADYLDKNPVVKKTTDLISAAPAALETIRMSTSNDIASTALAPQLARMAGETGSLSANDVNRWAKSGGLDDRLISGATSFFTGKTTVAKKEQAEKYVSAVFRGALLEQKRMLQDKAKEFGYLESPNYKARLESIDNQLARFKKPSENKPVDSVVRVQPTGNPLIDKYLNVQTP
jgi:hypothetical protein